MSQQRTYICNVCHWNTTDAEQIRGIRWTGIGSKALEPRVANECETHVCVPCLRALRDFIHTYCDNIG